MPTVLIVEDEPTTRELLCQYLGRSYACRPAGSAEVGLALLAEGGVDVVVTDVKLPGMDGEEFLRAARELRPSLPVIVISGGYGYDQDRFLQAGAFAYLLKPFRLEELVVIIERALGARKA